MTNTKRQPRGERTTLSTHNKEEPCQHIVMELLDAVPTKKKITCTCNFHCTINIQITSVVKPKSIKFLEIEI